MKDYDDMSVEEIQKLYDKTYNELANEIKGKVSKKKLSLLVELERQLCKEEYTSNLERR